MTQSRVQLSSRSRWWIGACMVVGLAGLLRAEVPDAPVDLSQYFGFEPLEVFKLQERSQNLLAADVTGDNRLDLLLIDNGNNRLDLLAQQGAGEEKKADEGKPEPTKEAEGRVNRIENDKRFTHRKLPVDKSVASMSVGDFNNDGRKDIVCLAAPDQLQIRRQTPQGDFTTTQRIRLPDVLQQQWSLAAGDLDTDGKDDVVVLGKTTTYVLYQDAEGELRTPVRLMNTSESLGLAQLADLDGDSRLDLCYLVNDDSDRPFGARLQGTDGKLGAEIRCELPKPRGLTLAEIDGLPGHEIIAIEAQTGRVKVHQLQRPQAEAGELAGQLIQYGFGQQGTGRTRDIALGDLDADGLTDIVVTDPEAAQLILFRQRRGSGLDLGTPFPSLQGVEQVRIADVDGDGKNEVIVLSLREKVLGLCRLEADRLTFPQAIVTTGGALGPQSTLKLTAVDTVDLNKDGRSEIVGTFVSPGDGKCVLGGITWQDGEWRDTSLPPATGPIELGIKDEPERLQNVDVNKDGVPDFIAFRGNERAPVVVVSDAGKDGTAGKYVVNSREGSFGIGKSGSGSVCLGQLEEPVILVAQNNFARSIAWSTQNRWDVKDQFNAPDADAKIAGAATLDLDGEAGNEVALIDTGSKKIRVLKRREKLYEPWREVDIGPLAFKSAHTADLNGDGRSDLLLFSPGKFGVLYAGQSDPRLKTLSTYETKLEETLFNDVAAGDLNGDGRLDVAILDTRSQFIDVATWRPGVGLVHALAFKLFEAKTFQDEENAGSEPREAVIADVTGDGRADLVLLSHDRILVYPQDAGAAVIPAPNAD
jgi:hypothetical protein